jgi:hypothetical protein
VAETPSVARSYSRRARARRGPRAAGRGPRAARAAAARLFKPSARKFSEKRCAGAHIRAKPVDEDDGRLALSVLVACALPFDATLDVVTPVGELQFLGQIGIAPGWTSVPISRKHAELITSCALAQLSRDGLVTITSLRGTGQPADPDEILEFSAAEGRFFGNVLGDGPQVMEACRGTGQFDPPAAGMSDRFCAVPDPDHPGLTLCGLQFAGDCSVVCRGEHCEHYRALATFVTP